MPIRIIANDYHNLFASANTDKSFGLSLLCYTPYQSPLKLLKSLNDFLIKINLNVFLVLEDLDRTNSHVMYHEIGAFLDACQKQSKIRCFIALAQEKNEGIIVRCCDYIHHIPQPLYNSSRKYCKRIIEQYYSKYKPMCAANNIILPDTICKAFSTPREVKHFAKGVCLLIEYYNEYLSLDDLLVWQALLTTQGRYQYSGYQFLIEHQKILKDASKELFIKPYCDFMKGNSSASPSKEIPIYVQKMNKKKVALEQQDLIISLVQFAKK